MSDDQPKERPRSRNRARAGRGGGGLRQLPWRQVRNPYPPMAILSDDQIEAIHLSSLKVLEEIGMDFLNEDARRLLKERGADVDPSSVRVRFDRGLILESIRTVPPSFTLPARNPAHDLHIGDNVINIATVGSAPYVSDIEGGRRDGNFADFNDLLRLAQSCNMVHMNGGYPVEPIDLPPESRHLDCLHSFLTLTDKIPYVYSLGHQRTGDGLDMLCLAHGRTREQMLDRPAIFSVVNTSSPLRVDRPMLDGIMTLSAAGQVIVVTPFTLSGAMSPVTVPGAIVQQNAEALATIAFTQMVRPGAPVMYGGFTSNVDMRSGAPAFGTPEYARAVLVGGQLARRYRIPYRSSNVNASNWPDEQSVYESMMSIWPVTLAHTNLILHGCGWLEGGLCASFEKFMLDVEMFQHMAEFLVPLTIDDDTMGLDAMREVGPGGHFFGAAHTMARYETAFYEPMLSDWRNYKAWEEAGSVTATRRAHALYKRVLADYEPPPIDPATKDALDDFVARRKREIHGPA